MKIALVLRRMAALLPIVAVAAVAPLAASPLSASAAAPAAHTGLTVSHVRHTLTAAAPTAKAPRAPAATCNQQSFAWLLTDSGSLITTIPGLSVTVPPTGKLTFTGVGQPGQLMAFDFFDTNGVFVNEVRTQAANDNCVVNQATIPANLVVPAGQFIVTASFVPWESPTIVDTVVMGTLTT